MLWVIVFGAIALGGLVMVVCFAIWIWRKSQALLTEVGGLLERADELIGLLDQIEVPVERGVPAGFDRTSRADRAEIDDAEMGLSAEGAT